jgi:hypothetical protein
MGRDARTPSVPDDLTGVHQERTKAEHDRRVSTMAAVGPTPTSVTEVTFDAAQTLRAV